MPLRAGRAPRGRRGRQRLGAGSTDPPGGSRSRGRKAEALPSAGAAGAPARVCRYGQPQTCGVRQGCSGSGGLRIRPVGPRDCGTGAYPNRKPSAKDQARRRHLTEHLTKAKLPQTHASFLQFQKIFGLFPPPKSICLRTNAGRIQQTNGHLNGESSTYGSPNTPPLTFSVRLSPHRHHIVARPPLDRRPNGGGPLASVRVSWAGFFTETG
jgi:hypothetical protein